jgi:hypothetical protein
MNAGRALRRCARRCSLLSTPIGTLRGEPVERRCLGPLSPRVLYQVGQLVPRLPPAPNFSTNTQNRNNRPRASRAVILDPVDSSWLNENDRLVLV